MWRFRMKEITRLTVNLPEELLRKAMKVSRANKTTTLVQGLQQLIKNQAYQELKQLGGKIDFDLDLKKTRK
jgi:hypothetical protein